MAGNIFQAVFVLIFSESQRITTMTPNNAVVDLIIDACWASVNVKTYINPRFRSVLDSHSAVAALFSVASVTFCSGLLDSNLFRLPLLAGLSLSLRLFQRMFGECMCLSSESQAMILCCISDLELQLVGESEPDFVNTEMAYSALSMSKKPKISDTTSHMLLYWLIVASHLQPMSPRFALLLLLWRLFSRRFSGHSSLLRMHSAFPICAHGIEMHLNGWGFVLTVHFTKVSDAVRAKWITRLSSLKTWL